MPEFKVTGFNQDEMAKVISDKRSGSLTSGY